MMDGSFQDGDNLFGVWGPECPDGQAGDSIGRYGVTRITVSKAAGPMGWYAVAEVFVGENEDLARVYPLHMMEVIQISKPDFTA